MISRITLAATAALTLHAAAGETLEFTPLSTVRLGDPISLFDASAAEIVKFDAASQRMFVVNGDSDSIDIFDISTPAVPVFIKSVDLSAYGNPNSVSVNPRQGVDEIAVAVGASSKDQRGTVVFLTTDGVELDAVTVGYLPDMLTYDKSGRMIVVANEAEPTEDYSFDPEGSVSIIEMRGRKRRHTEVTFSHLTEADVVGVRITGPEGTTIAQDLEPEFVAIEGRYAFVSCQENNAVAKIDLLRKSVDSILPLGRINHGLLGYAFDASDRDDMINIANWPVFGLFMPDGIATYTVGGTPGRFGLGRSEQTYFLTANEGDAREWGDYIDEDRIKDLDLDPSAFPLADVLQEDENIGRLDGITTEGDIDGDGDYDELYHFGTRSFSIFDADGHLVFDSGDMIETYLAENYPENFNCAHDENDSFDSRSDAKGAEPESVEVGTIDDCTYAFVGLERFSAIIVFDITDPTDVSIAGFAINRDFGVEFDEDDLANFPLAGDLGPEGLDFVPASKSPTGQPLLIVANEVSGTTTIYSIGAGE
ncbi:alkaline phosphatase protein [Haloferula helveola]|uniref:Alkaline phosphatase protein n=1 Tax=Haloferula helveola TaxID=490095 RepID=A0ABN6H0M4_9BACT|nr:alkaline phosphatase protein [Haloferula helveola]